MEGGMSIIGYVEVDVIAICLCLFILVANRKRDVGLFNSKKFEYVIVGTLAMTIFDTIMWLIQYRVIYSTPKFYEILFALYFIMQILILMLTMNYLKYIYKRKVNIVEKIFNYIPLLLIGVCCVTNFVNNSSFKVLRDFSYIKLTGYYIITFVTMIYNLIAVVIVVYQYITAEKKYKQMYLCIVIAISVPILVSVLAVFINGIVVWAIIALDMMFLYLGVHREQLNILEEKLEKNKVAIMMSQIQPHFLYNSIATIRALCEEEPEKASDALLSFSMFLRANMDSLSSKSPIHFSKELEHVKNYLELEKLRFGDDLEIEYDIQVEDFFLPALTLQPIVENAVKYGIGDKIGGGRVTIRTVEVGSDVYISVIDNGKGIYANSIQDIPAKNDGRTHIGLVNVENRIVEMMGGYVQFSSRLEEGTYVNIVIPR